MPAGEPIEHIEAIRGWLEHDGFGLDEIADPETALTLEAERPEDFAYTIVHPDAQADHVFVGLAMPGEELTDALAEIGPEETEMFLTDLRFGLLGMGVEFEGLDVPTEQVTMFIPAYFDGLSKDRFMEKLRKVKNAGLFLQWSLGPAEEAPQAPPDPGGEHYIR